MSRLKDWKSFMKSDLSRIFFPKNLAIIGVSSKGSGFGSGILRSLLAVGYEGQIYPVNPKGGDFAGYKIYKDVNDIHETIDFAIIAVPAEFVPDALDKCRQKGAAGAEILSAGFRETKTEKGIELEKKIKKIAAKGIRVIGPNCFGIYCPKSGLTLLPGPDLSRESGTVSFISQSGAMSIDFAYLGQWTGIQFSKVISFGNGADLRETELLEYLGKDDQTKIVCMYIEGVENGRSFFSVLKDVAAKKPVIIYKAGRSIAGKRAAASHTASMSGDSIIWNALIKQCNAVSVESLWEMANVTLAFSMLPTRVYKQISVIGGSGATGVIASDMAETFGFRLPQFDKKLIENILEFLPKPGSSAPNPVDVANAYVRPHKLEKILMHTASAETIDIQILFQFLHHYKSLAIKIGAKSLDDITPYRELSKCVQKISKSTDKPVILILPDIRQEIESLDVEKTIRCARSAFLECNIPVFSDIKDAFHAISCVSTHYLCKEKREK